MKILVDMNLSPAWVSVLTAAGHEAMHWSTIGAGNAPDSIILAWAKERNYVLFTHDLDFGAILAATNAAAPSVLQLRTQDISPDHANALLVEAMKQFDGILARGALVTVDERRTRARVLPINRPDAD